MALSATLNFAFGSLDAFLDTGIQGLHARMLSAGWTLVEELSAVVGAQDRVYYSVGESGEQALWLRATHDSATDRLHFRAYSCWVAGAPGTGYNAVGDILGNTCVQLVNGVMQGWIIADADGVTIVADIDGGTTYNKGFFGAVTPSVPLQRGFYGRLAGQATGVNQTGTTTLLFAAGTDFSDVQAGQQLWVVNQSITSGPGNVERVQVDSINVGARTIELNAALTEDYDALAIVAIDPQPIVLWGSSAGVLPATAVALHHTDAYASTTVTRTSLADGIGLSALATEDYGHIHLSPNVFYDDTAGRQHVKGETPRVVRPFTGPLIALDDVVVSADTYRAFPDGAGFFCVLET